MQYPGLTHVMVIVHYFAGLTHSSVVNVLLHHNTIGASFDLLSIMYNYDVEHCRGRDLLKDTVHFVVMYLLPLSMRCVGTCCRLSNLVYTPTVQPYVYSSSALLVCESIRKYLNLMNCADHQWY